MKIIQFEIGPANQHYQSALIGLGDDGTIYRELTKPDGEKVWVALIESKDVEAQS